MAMSISIYFLYRKSPRPISCLYLISLRLEVNIWFMWSPVNKIDNLNRDFFVLCHD